MMVLRWCWHIMVAFSFLLAAGAAAGQNPYVVLLPPELKARQLQLVTYLRDKPGFKLDVENTFLDLKNAMDADTYPNDGNRDGQVSVDEVKKQIMRLPSNRVEYRGKPDVLQDAAKGRILGWEDKYPDGRPGDNVYDLDGAIRNRMQELGGKYSEEFARVARFFDDYRSHILKHADDSQFLPKFNPDSPENRVYARTVLAGKRSEFQATVKNQAREEKKLAQTPAGPEDLLHYAWHLVTTDPAILSR